MEEPEVSFAEILSNVIKPAIGVSLAPSNSNTLPRVEAQEVLGIKADDLLQYLKSKLGNEWADDLRARLKTLEPHGFVDFALHGDKITFYGKDTDLKHHILPLMIPAYISESLADPQIAKLKKPLIPEEIIGDYFEDRKVKGVLVQQRCTFAWSPNCGSQVEDKHARFLIAHSDPMNVTCWLWDVLGCFEFINVTKMSDTEDNYVCSTK